MAPRTNRIHKYQNEIWNDATYILNHGLAQKADRECLEKPWANSSSLYSLGHHLAQCANWHSRLAYHNILLEKPNIVGVQHSWSIQSLAQLFRELTRLEAARNCRSFSVWHETFAGCSALDFWGFAFCLWGRYAVGLFDDWKSLATLYEVWDWRGDHDVREDEENYRFPFELMRFLALDSPREGDIRALDKVAQLRGVAAAWHDDNAFAALTELWCQWHLDYSELRRADGWGLAVLPHDILFPSWVFALDRCRQNMVGRSALGQHDLIVSGQRFVAAISAENLPPPAVLVAAQQRYAVCGVEPPEVWRFWKEFVARS